MFTASSGNCGFASFVFVMGVFLWLALLFSAVSVARADDVIESMKLRSQLADNAGSLKPPINHVLQKKGSIKDTLKEKGHPAFNKKILGQAYDLFAIPEAKPVVTTTTAPGPEELKLQGLLKDLHENKVPDHKITVRDLNNLADIDRISEVKANESYQLLVSRSAVVAMHLDKTRKLEVQYTAEVLHLKSVLNSTKELLAKANMEEYIAKKAAAMAEEQFDQVEEVYRKTVAHAAVFKLDEKRDARDHANAVLRKLIKQRQALERRIDQISEEIVYPQKELNKVNEAVKNLERERYTLAKEIALAQSFIANKALEIQRVKEIALKRAEESEKADETIKQYWEEVEKKKARETAAREAHEEKAKQRVEHKYKAEKEESVKAEVAKKKKDLVEAHQKDAVMAEKKQIELDLERKGKKEEADFLADEERNKQFEVKRHYYLKQYKAALRRYEAQLESNHTYERERLEQIVKKVKHLKGVVDRGARYETLVNTGWFLTAAENLKAAKEKIKVFHLQLVLSPHDPELKAVYAQLQKEISLREAESRAENVTDRHIILAQFKAKLRFIEAQIESSQNDPIQGLGLKSIRDHLQEIIARGARPPTAAEIREDNRRSPELMERVIKKVEARLKLSPDDPQLKGMYAQLQIGLARLESRGIYPVDFEAQQNEAILGKVAHNVAEDLAVHDGKYGKFLGIPINKPIKQIPCKICKQFAPHLYFDKKAGEYGYPMSADVYRTAQYMKDPRVEEEDSLGLQNVDGATVSGGKIPTYWRVSNVDGVKIISYWFFYGLQRSCLSESDSKMTIDNKERHSGRHHGDWESIDVRLTSDESAVDAVVFKQHGGLGWYTRLRGHFEIDGTHPKVYVGRISHGAYHDKYVSEGDKDNAGRGSHPCLYFGDFRDPSGGVVMKSEDNLIGLLEDDIHSEQWMVNERKHDVGNSSLSWGPPHGEKDEGGSFVLPSLYGRGYDVTHEFEACKGEDGIGGSDGCYASSCPTGFMKEEYKCFKRRCPDGYVSYGSRTEKDCKKAPEGLVVDQKTTPDEFEYTALNLPLVQLH